MNNNKTPNALAGFDKMKLFKCFIFDFLWINGTVYAFSTQKISTSG